MQGKKGLQNCATWTKWRVLSTSFTKFKLQGCFIFLAIIISEFMQYLLPEAKIMMYIFWDYFALQEIAKYLDRFCLNYLTSLYKSKWRKVRLVRDHLPISFLILSELINFYSPWNHQKTIGSLMISGRIEVN